MCLQKLDCRLEYTNPPDFKWGSVINGSATGMFKELVEDRVDIVLGATILYDSRILVAFDPEYYSILLLCLS